MADPQLRRHKCEDLTRIGVLLKEIATNVRGDSLDSVWPFGLKSYQSWVHFKFRRW
jgi:hypothetical protein